MTTADRKAWLAERRLGLGATDAAAILGLSPWKTALEVYHDKLGTLPEKEATPAMRWGLLLEDAIACAYEEHTGQQLEKPSEPIWWHLDHPWMCASLDRITTRGRRVVELKTAQAFHAGAWGAPGSDQVPEQYLLQVQHQMAVADADEADVAVLIGGRDFRVYTVPRSEAIIRHLVTRLEVFWRDHVQARVPPAADWGHSSTPWLIEQLHQPVEGAVVNLNDEAVALAAEYQYLGEVIRTGEAARRQLRARLVERMGSAAVAWLPTGSRLTRKEVTRKEHTVKEATYVDFRIYPPKETPS